MKNVTITLDEEVARWARVRAAEHDTSVSRLVGEMLKEQMESEGQYEKARKAFLKQPAKALKTTGGYPSRGDIHERSMLR